MARTAKKKETTPAPAPEAHEQTTPVQEEALAPAPAPELDPAPEVQESQGDTPDPFTPYQATVAQPLVVVRRGKVPNPKDKPIGTLARGARVTVTASLGGYAILDNGTYIKERYLERKAT